MFDNDEKLQMFFDKKLWERAIQHCINKGIWPMELSQYTDAQFRGWLYEVMVTRQYKVAPPHIAQIPKENGEFRKVYVNTVLDRLVLTIINEVYCTMYKDMIHSNCVSYQKGIGVKKIIGNIVSEISASKGIAGYKIDISKYFDSVSRGEMNAALESVSSNSCLDQILYDYYNDDIIMDEHGQIVKKYKSLCQGCAPSAFFANIILRDIDAEMSAMCPVYYRYSDDILLLGEKANEALALLSTLLKKKGLSINPKKVEQISSDKWFTFLGCRIKGDIVSFSKKSLNNYMEHVETAIKKYGIDNSAKALSKIIKSLNAYLYNDHLKNHSAFGWAEYFFGIVNCKQDIVLLDTWTKDMLRGVYTGKGGRKNVGGIGIIDGISSTLSRGKGKKVTSNKIKTEGILQANGYVSMNHLYKLYREVGHDVFITEIHNHVI